MKAKQLLFCLGILVMALASCTTEEQPPTISYVFTDVSSEAGETSVVITCRNESVDDDKVQASVLLSKNENITDATKYPLKLKNDTLRSSINGLEHNTIYYFCFEVYTANEHKRTDPVYHFSTQGANVTVTTSEAINITQTGVTGGGNVTASGDITVGMRGVCWDTVPNPNALQSPHLTSGEGTGTFMLNITGLKPNTAYYMKAYAVSGDVVYYGNEVSFTTLHDANLPTVETFQVNNITHTSAQGGGAVTDDGTAAVTERGICWNTDHNPTTNGSHVTCGVGVGDFYGDITGLNPYTTYYVRAYAKNSNGISYGSEVSFTTTTSEIFSESFYSGQGDFIIQNVVMPSELSYVWTHNPLYNDMKASAFVGQGYETESWLVSPAISLVGVSSARLEFDQAVNYGSPLGVLKVMISTNFAGSVTTATWNELNLNRWPDGNNWLFITSFADLTNYIGQTLTIAFKYTSNTSVCPTWEIKNVVVK